MKKTKLQNFIKNASDDDWNQLATLIKQAPKRAEALPTKQFPFSYSAIAKELEARGLIQINHKRKNEIKRNETSNDERQFVIDQVIDSGQELRRTVTFDVNIYDRIKKLEEDHKQYKKTAILNKLLDEVLKKYDY